MLFWARHAASIDALNRRIDEFNLSVPVVSLQMVRINRPSVMAAIEDVLPPTLD